MANRSSAFIPNTGFSPTVLPTLNAPGAVTTFSSHARAFVYGPGWLLGWQHPANGRNRRPSSRPLLSRVPARPWVLSAPKRLRYYLQHDPAIETLALRIFLIVVEQVLRSRPGCGCLHLSHRDYGLLEQPWRLTPLGGRSYTQPRMSVALGQPRPIAAAT